MKYSLTYNTITLNGVALHQIKAEIDIPRFGIKAGDLGGWIEKESNLSHDGDAWVYGEATVRDNATVSGEAIVSGKARVSDNATVSGKAIVSGNARVSDNATVSGEAIVSGKARVSDNATVSGKARVSDNAIVSGEAIVSGNATVSGKARVSQGQYNIQVLSISTLPYQITAIYPNHVQIGCKLFEICGKKEATKAMLDNRIDVKYHNQIWMAVQLCKQWLKDNPEPAKGE